MNMYKNIVCSVPFLSNVHLYFLNPMLFAFCAKIFLSKIIRCSNLKIFVFFYIFTKGVSFIILYSILFLEK